MWDVMWYLGFPMFAVSVFGAPHSKYYELDNDSLFNADQFDTIYDERQNGTANVKLNIEGVSLIWSPNALVAAAALLEPALYGEYPDTSVDMLLGTEGKPGIKPESQSKEIGKELDDKPAANSDVLAPTVLVLDGNQLTVQKPSLLENAAGSKRKLRLPGIIGPLLRKNFPTSPPSKSSPPIS